MEPELERIADQHRHLTFEHFDEDTAWQVGSRSRELAAARDQSIAIEVRLGGHTVVVSPMVGTSPENADWVRQEQNVVEVLAEACGVDDADIRLPEL